MGGSIGVIVGAVLGVAAFCVAAWWCGFFSDKPVSDLQPMMTTYAVGNKSPQVLSSKGSPNTMGAYGGNNRSNPSMTGSFSPAYAQPPQYSAQKSAYSAQVYNQSPSYSQTQNPPAPPGYNIPYASPVNQGPIYDTANKMNESTNFKAGLIPINQMQRTGSTQMMQPPLSSSERKRQEAAAGGGGGGGGGSNIMDDV